MVDDVQNGLGCGLDVEFFDMSVADPANNIVAVSYFWNFGDGTTLQTAEQATEEAPLVHRYAEEGFFSVTLEVTFEDTSTSQTTTNSHTKTEYIYVGPCPTSGEGEGEGEGGTEGEATDDPVATFAVNTLIRDKEALLPLSDWVPLVNFTMGYDPETPAPRFLRLFEYTLHQDPRPPDDLDYGDQNGPTLTDILEFGLFVEFASDDDDYDRVFDPFFDDLVYAWDTTGTELFVGGQIAEVTTFGGEIGYQSYRLDFIGAGTFVEPEFPLPAGPIGDDGLEGYSYILAVCTSPT